ncbi:glutamate--tRNA ligase [Mycoemilia scoparia]|uniref:Probable glutamate--tRNA ligase, cytoplasmic n=1 Tax=Mycoemilia scoparia TaxID=417184 RepID=A0A9W8DLN0_9FUNG|nr:glutamate--tRNA ligase [Mycoemilia scoparia]
MPSLTLAKKGFPTPWPHAGIAEFINHVLGKQEIKAAWIEGNTVDIPSDSNKKKEPALIAMDDDSDHNKDIYIGGKLSLSKMLVRYSRDIGYLDPAVVEWVTLYGESMAAGPKSPGLADALAKLDHHLAMRTFLVGYQVTAADVVIWGALRHTASFQQGLKTNPASVGINLARFYLFVDSLPFIKKAVAGFESAKPSKETAAAATSAAAGAATDAATGGNKGSTRAGEQGKFELNVKNLEYGKVCTRFPPEPSGYLHIGHVKAALLNEHIAHANGGKLIVRFDDTNPTKEKMEYQDAIIADLATLGIKGDVTSFTSDYFDVIYDYAIRIIKKGLAYVDDTDQPTMQHERMHGIASKSRDLSVEENLARFKEMESATEFGKQCCLRAKMSVDNKNKAMRDPVIYRVNEIPHHRTGSKWKIYPTYDFACPIVDSIEGVTHALRSNEYTDREPQFRWFLEKLELRDVHIEGYSRVNFVYTLLSKRKLQWFVNEGLVGGWDDPRFPTVRGIVRRGMTIEALREYMLSMGASKNALMLEWDKLWALNKKVIDPVAPRHTAVASENAVLAKISNVEETPSTKSVPRHKKNPELGEKTTSYSNLVYFDQADAASFEQDEEITMMDWGNAFVRSIERSEDGKIVTGLALEFNPNGNFKTTKKKVTWLAKDNSRPLVPADLLDYDYLITKKKLEDGDELSDHLTKQSLFVTPGFVDPNVVDLKKGDIIQLERKGYYIVDETAKDHASGKIQLIYIPDGKVKSIASKSSSGADSGKKDKKKNKEEGNGGEKKKKANNKKAAAARAGVSAASSNIPPMYQMHSLYEELKVPRPEEVSKMYVVDTLY